jgi:hypothetical protein
MGILLLRKIQEPPHKKILTMGKMKVFLLLTLRHLQTTMVDIPFPAF